MVRADQVLTKLAVIVDFAVENHMDVSVFIRNGLVRSFRQVDDPQPRITESSGAVQTITGRVRATVTNGCAHPEDVTGLRRGGP